MTFAETSVRHSLLSHYESSRVRIGVVLDTRAVPKWIHQILTQLDDAIHAELVLILNIQSDRRAKISTTRRMPSLFELWQHLDYKVFGGRSMHADTFDLLTFTPHGSHPQIINCRLQPDKQYGLKESDLQTIKSAQLHVLLDLSRTAPRQQLQECARYGVWSFDETDDLLRSLYRDFHQHRLTIQSGVNILFGHHNISLVPCSCSAIEPFSLFRNYSNLCWKRSTMLAQVLADLRYYGWQYIHDSLQRADADSIPTPSNVATLRLLTRLLLRSAKHRIRTRLFHEKWFVAFRNKNIHENELPSESSLTILHAPHGRFYADPFAIDRGDRSYIFFEDFSYRERKGIISYVEIDSLKGCSAPEPVLEEDYHLSYPFLFEWEGEVYLIPETKANRTVQLYRATQFPRGWQLVKVLLSDVAAVDSTLFHHQGQFWLFTSGIGTSDPWFNGHSELFLFFSDSLLGTWTPHPRNPVVSDVRRSRPAGQIFSSNGQLIRPAQDYSAADSYAVTLNLIDKLSEHEYHEVPVATLSPTWMKGNIGTHTFNQSQRYEVLDGRTLAGPLCRRRTQPALQTVKLSRPLIQNLTP